MFFSATFVDFKDQLRSLLEKEKKAAESSFKLSQSEQAKLAELKERRQKIEALEASNNNEDLELCEEGFYYKVSEVKAGKKLRYCAACYNNTGKLYPITAGSLSRDFFCTNCRMRYNDWRILKL